MPATPNKNYRENSERSIYICEQFSDKLLQQLTPVINKLRLGSTDPITVYLDSPGGNPAISERLKRLLKAPDQDGKSRRIITVATNDVASAAADLLIAGDYAIAYDHAEILVHGTRMTRPTVTNEEAQMLAQALNISNSIYAQRLAEIAVFNLAFLARTFSADVAAENAPGGFVDQFEKIGKLGAFIRGNLSESNQGIVTSVLNDLRSYQQLATHLYTKLENVPEGIERDVQTLKLIVDWKFEQLRGNPDAAIDENFLLRVQRSYFDYLRFEHKLFDRTFNRVYEEIAVNLMSPDQQAEHAKLPPKDQRGFLNKHAFWEFYPIYLFSTMLAHRLQSGENNLTAHDAYYLGLINEVVGSSLPCMRDAEELGDPELPLEPSGEGTRKPV